MRKRLHWPALVVGLVLATSSSGALAQSAASRAPGGSARAATHPTLRTSWGHPDLEGVWSTATITPFERPPELAGKTFLSESEAAEFEQQTLARTNRDRRD